jgi:hypothetical protein
VHAAALLTKVLALVALAVLAEVVAAVALRAMVLAAFRASLGAGAHLLVVFLVIDACALVMLGPLQALLLKAPDMAIAACVGFHAVGVRLSAFEAAGFALRQRTAVEALLDALLLIDVALHVGLHPLRGR